MTMFTQCELLHEGVGIRVSLNKAVLKDTAASTMETDVAIVRKGLFK